MIYQFKNRTPFIHFGFNEQSHTAQVGDEITVYQDSIYSDEFTHAITSTGATIVSSDKNKCVLTFASSGSYTVKYVMSNKAKTKTFDSETLNITIT